MDHTRQVRDTRQTDDERRRRSHSSPNGQEREIEPMGVVPEALSELSSLRGNPGIRQSLVMQMQRRQGNQQVLRMLADDERLVQRLPAAPRVPTLPAQSAPLATTPAGELTPLPEDIRREHQTRVSTGDLNGALTVVAQHMESHGEIDTNLMAAPTPATGAAVCSGTTRYIVGPASMGSTAAVTPCGSTPRGNEQVPNIRIQVGPGAIRRVETLHSTLFHEFRHVRQQYEQSNRPGRGTRFTSRPTDCNQPEEMDAYLSEIEAGYDRHAVMHAWVRVYVNWPWLAPEQQQLFLPRHVTARRKVDRLFPNVPWEANALVATYRQHCQDVDRAAGGDTQGSCDSPMAPLSAPGPRWGAPVPEPSEVPPVGDFPQPPERRGAA